jgi:hypothetical protein
MSMIDFFNPSFLFFIGFFTLIIAILVVYFESKSRMQNLKITSMFSIISTLAEDLNSIKLALNQIPFNEFNGGSPFLAKDDVLFHNQEQTKLIEVSDEEEDDDSEDENDEHEEDHEDDDDDEEDEEDDDEEDDEDEDELDDNIEDSESESEVNNIKVLNITNLEPHLEKNNNEDYEEDLIEPLELESLETLEEMKNEKSIKIDLGETINNEIDYKKFTLQKLKNIVTEKGLATDTSKLKKPELLKLLGIE